MASSLNMLGRASTMASGSVSGRRYLISTASVAPSLKRCNRYTRRLSAGREAVSLKAIIWRTGLDYAHAAPGSQWRAESLWSALLGHRQRELGLRGKFHPDSYAEAYKRFESHFPRFHNQPLFLIARGPDGNNPHENAAWTQSFFQHLSQ